MKNMTTRQRLIESGTDPDQRIGDFKVLELHEAFDLVKDPTNWKNPIDAMIPVPRSREKRARMLDAIRRATVFFAGSVATITPDIPGRVRVEADGYYRFLKALDPFDDWARERPLADVDGRQARIPREADGRVDRAGAAAGPRSGSQSTRRREVTGGRSGNVAARVRDRGDGLRR
jgi:hypothetical protein